MAPGIHLSQLLLDVCREHAHRGSTCHVAYIPPRCRKPQSVDCFIDSVGKNGRVNLRPLYSRDWLSVPIGRLRRVRVLKRPTAQSASQHKAISAAMRR